MNARPCPQKKGVDSIVLNASLHPLEAPTKRSATQTSWMTFAMIMRLQKLHARIPQDSMIQLNTNRSLQSHVTSTGNRYQLSMQPFHIHGQPPQNIEQSPKTIPKEWMQDNIHGRKMSTTLLWIISASTWGSDQTIRSNVQLNAARTENAVAKTPCLNPTGLYDPTKHKSILAVTYHLTRNQNSIFNAAVPCPRTVPTEHGTITKHNLQRMNARPYPQKKDVDNIVLNASLHPLQNRNFTSICNVQRPFRAKGLQGAPQNRNITSVFDVQHPFRAKGLRRTN